MMLYQVLSSDIKSIVSAASDFSSELDKVEIKKTVLEVSHKENISSKLSSEDISALNSLGNKVAEIRGEAEA